MSAQKRSCPGLEAGEAALLCRVEERWNSVVAKISFGLEPLCPALQNFLLFLGHILEVAGETSEVDMILANVGRAKLPDGKGLSELESQSLRVIEERWTNTAREIRVSTLSLQLGFYEFMMFVGKYLLGRAGPKLAVGRSCAEKQQRVMEEFYRSRGFSEVKVPLVSIGDEQMSLWFADGKNLIFEPSERDLSVELLMQQLPHEFKLDDPAKIIWEPVEEERWLLVDAEEQCPQVGERSFEGFRLALEDGQRILTLPQYAITWHLGGAGGEILDISTDTMLATRYGADSVVHAFGNFATRDLTFSIGEWRHLATRHPRMGIRTARIVE